MPLKGLGNVKKGMDNIYTTTNDDLRAIYFTGLFAITEQTPVDEGRARNNWFLSVEIPSSKTTKRKGSGLGTINSLRAMPKRILNRKILYTNNLPYIGVLEYGGFPTANSDKTLFGFSRQAPGGWVRKTLIRMQNQIRKL